MIDENDGTNRDRVVRKQLDTIVTNLDFEDRELSQVFQSLRDVSGASIHVKWRALVLESIEPATTVNVHLSNVTFRKALETILEDVATGGQLGVGATGLGYVIQDGVISISTKEDLSRCTVVKTYSIQAILEQSKTKDPQEVVSHLIELIGEVVDPDSWRIAGGEAGSIRELNGQLIIRQTYHNHEAIQDLLSRFEHETVFADTGVIESNSQKDGASELDYVNITTEEELMDFLCDKATQPETKFTGYIAQSSSDDGNKVVTVNVTKDDKTLSYCLCADTLADAIHFQNILKGTFSPDGFQISKASIIGYADRSQRQSERQQQIDKVETGRFHITTTVKIVGIIISVVVVIVGACLRMHCSPQAPDRGVGKSVQPSTRSTTQKATTTPTTKPSAPSDFSDIKTPPPAGPMRSARDHL